MYVGSTLCCLFIKLDLQMKQISLGLVVGLSLWYYSSNLVKEYVYSGVCRQTRVRISVLNILSTTQLLLFIWSKGWLWFSPAAVKHQVKYTGRKKGII